MQPTPAGKLHETHGDEALIYSCLPLLQGWKLTGENMAEFYSLLVVYLKRFG